MARRYDSQTTTFSPEGRLFQVEYAIAAIQNAAAAVGIQSKGGIVVASEKRVASKLLTPPKSSEKTFKVDEHVFAAVAGLTSDANILINYARLAAQRYRFVYGEEQPMEALVQLVCDYKHSYTQHGGLRPFGVSFLFAGWDRHFGYQLYQSDPAGNYSGWKATAIGSNSQSAQSKLKSEFNEDLSFADAQKLAVRILTKAMDTTHPTFEKMEVAILTHEGGGPGEGPKRLVQRCLSAKEVGELIAEALAATATSGDV